MNLTVYPLTLYYDASCPMCNAEMTHLRLRDQAGRLAFVDASAPGFDAPPPGTTVAELLTLIHARRADGTVVRGVEVFQLAYAAVGLHTVSRPLAWPGVRRLADALYPWLARNRYRLPRVLVRVVFEGRIRRAAATAHARARCTDGTCRL